MVLHNHTLQNKKLSEKHRSITFKESAKCFDTILDIKLKLMQTSTCQENI